MTDESSSQPMHYSDITGGDGEELFRRVQSLIAAHEGTLTDEQFAAFDQFHCGGLEATKRFVQMLSLSSGMKVLDAGSGLGGQSRYVAEQYGCDVIGVDLTATYVSVAQLLAQHLGLSDRVKYAVGDVCELGQGLNYFDAVYTQHVGMNVANKSQFYSSVYDCLKFSGKFGVFDVIATGENDAIQYPLPWATTAKECYLVTEQNLLGLMSSCGFRLEQWSDVTAEVIEWAGRCKAERRSDVKFDLRAVMGDRFALMSRNLVRALQDDKLRVVMAVFLRQ